MTESGRRSFERLELNSMLKGAVNRFIGEIVDKELGPTLLNGEPSAKLHMRAIEQTLMASWTPEDSTTASMPDPDRSIERRPFARISLHQMIADALHSSTERIVDLRNVVDRQFIIGAEFTTLRRTAIDETLARWWPI